MYHEEYYANFGNMSVEEYVQTCFLTAEQIDRFIQIVDMIPDDVESILDVGAGLGHLLEYVEKRKGIKGLGIEITDAKIEYARERGIDLRKGDASDLQFPDKSFDIVVSCEVIEHLPYGVYEKALKEIARVSRKYVLIEVPFDEKRRFVRCPYCGATSHPSYHMRSYNERTMESLFPSARLIEMKKIGRMREPVFADLLSYIPQRSWPPLLVCPSCGYRNQNPSKDTKKEVKSLFILRLLRSFPIFYRTKPSSIVCLYSHE
ncbi:MAG: class I SAM-dependent methyltransferase [Roseiflexaceae bacterium]|nr:class I SAM-dependent methyltransferase [Roseiflexaceae bacterium]